ncbi:LysE family translocator [Roseovarius sp. CAU 1744]|uniref:LysE family translocator n=1 Tax=Roseovarius sp. CAU 1744 TaxID=3140368 RepID=UPI00325B6908
MVDLAPFLPGFVAAYAILLVGASSPGPSVAMLIGVATSQGRAPAMMATLGIATGSLTINLLTMLGVGLILSQAAWAMSALRLVGAAYLLYLAYGAFRKALNPPVLQPATARQRSGLHQFATGYLLQVTNPKAIAFWLAIASIGAVKGAGPGVIALFVAGAFLISFICHGLWALALSAQAVRQAYAAGRRWIETGLGAFFTFAAIKLAVDR